MSVIYSIACKQCKVTRDLDAFYTARENEVKNRAQALDFSKEITGDSFKAGLLVSFMADHSGHECVFFKEGDDCEDELNPFENKDGYIEDTDFWVNCN